MVSLRVSGVLGVLRFMRVLRDFKGFRGMSKENQSVKGDAKPEKILRVSKHIQRLKLSHNTNLLVILFGEPIKFKLRMKGILPLGFFYWDLLGIRTKI